MAHNDQPHIADIKLALAEKYTRLARAANSNTKRRSYLRRAERYRRQAAEIGTTGP